MKHNCIIVADSSRARFFQDTGNDDWVESAGLGHPESRHPNRDLTSDRSGRAFSSVGGSRHAMTDRTEPHQHESQVFAREVATHLKQSEPLANCNKIALVAPPQFLGLLRKQLDPAYRNKVCCEIDKNLVKREVADIRQQLPPRWPK